MGFGVVCVFAQVVDQLFTKCTWRIAGTERLASSKPTGDRWIGLLRGSVRWWRMSVPFRVR